ncbi:MAG: hypothetical protein ACXWHB_09930, partial [Usitatibacter sp.]
VRLLAMTYVAPLRTRFPLRQIRQRPASRLSALNAATACLGPIPGWDDSDKAVSAEDDMR